MSFSAIDKFDVMFTNRQFISLFNPDKPEYHNFIIHALSQYKTQLFVKYQNIDEKDKPLLDIYSKYLSVLIYLLENNFNDYSFYNLLNDVLTHSKNKVTTYERIRYIYCFILDCYDFIDKNLINKKGIKNINKLIDYILNPKDRKNIFADKNIAHNKKLFSAYIRVPQLIFLQNFLSIFKVSFNPISIPKRVHEPEYNPYKAQPIEYDEEGVPIEYDVLNKRIEPRYHFDESKIESQKICVPGPNVEFIKGPNINLNFVQYLESYDNIGTLGCPPDKYPKYNNGKYCCEDNGSSDEEMLSYINDLLQAQLNIISDTNFIKSKGAIIFLMQQRNFFIDKINEKYESYDESIKMPSELIQEIENPFVFQEDQEGYKSIEDWFGYMTRQTKPKTKGGFVKYSKSRRNKYNYSKNVRKNKKTQKKYFSRK
jgi:hypothetical protein